MSKFSKDELVDLLLREFVPVAFDQFYQRQRNDAEGEFYRKIASQGPRKNFKRTTQGCYVADAAGNLYGFNNNFGTERLLEVTRKALKEFNAAKIKIAPTKKLKRGTSDPKFDRTIAPGAVVVQVNSKVLYPAGTEFANEHARIFGTAISRDNLWVLPKELEDLSKGKLSQSLAFRIARFHLVDNTRGEPEMWGKDDIRQLEMEVLPGNKIGGSVYLKTKSGKRGYQAKLMGFFEIDDATGALKRFDLVALGEHWGKSRWVANAAKGKTPLAITFRLAKKNDIAFTVPPQGTKGWMKPYMSPVSD